jgi:catechol 2,3-dioxygenase-like lactoylglutathione lyase family enzyme
MRFHGICLVTHDVPRLRRFYVEQLGFAAEGDDGFVYLNADGAVLSLFSA